MLFVTFIELQGYNIEYETFLVNCQIRIIPGSEREANVWLYQSEKKKSK